MPEFSTRSMAMRVTWSMSTRRCSSSWIRYSKASLTFIFRFLVRWPKMLGNMSFMLTSISSTPWLVDDLERRESFVRGHRSPPCARRACLRAVAGAVFRGCAMPDSRRQPVLLSITTPPAVVAGARPRTRGDRRQQNIEQPLFGIQLGLVGNIFQLLFAHHVDGDLDQVADHRFHVAAHVADLGELRSFHFHEGRIRQLRQAARDFGFAHAGGPDHDDVLGDDFFGQFGRQLLPAHAIAQRDGDGALGVVLADDVFVELGDDFARSQFVER